jgi:hypothetical protein
MGKSSKDHRWLSPNGEEWDSRFEFQVYESIHNSGQAPVRRCTKDKRKESDTLVYTMPVRDASCDACKSTEVSKRRTYTPDLYSPDAYGRDDRVYSHAGFYIEIKGYLRADQRALLRAFCKARPDIDLRIVFQRDFKVGSGTATSWVSKYLKRPCCIWKGRLPEEWVSARSTDNAAIQAV